MPEIKTGPRGGKYYIKNGRKIYVKSKELSKKNRKSAAAGCSNRGKYKNVDPKFFCGPSGGACDGTYPVNTKARARAALAYARHAPNPQGIRNCVRRISRQQGWV